MIRDKLFLVVFKDPEEMRRFNDAYDRLSGPRPCFRTVCGDRVEASCAPGMAYERVLVQDGTPGFGRVKDVARAFSGFDYDVREFRDVKEALYLLKGGSATSLPFGADEGEMI